MLRRSLSIHLYSTPVENVANVQPAGVPLWVMWQLGKDTSHEPEGSNIPMVVDWKWMGIREVSQEGMT